MAAIGCPWPSLRSYLATCIDRHRGGPVRCFGNAQDGRIGVEEDLPVTTVLTIGPHRNHTAHQIEIEQVDLGGRRSGNIWDAGDLSAQERHRILRIHA